MLAECREQLARERLKSGRVGHDGAGPRAWQVIECDGYAALDRARVNVWCGHDERRDERDGHVAVQAYAHTGVYRG